MVGHTPPQLQTQAPSSVSAPLSAEDEALKRNTDCVYFLASPLTCKKGSECEYRHSDAARLNPRDCYYWLNGSCLNPKCAFRHPPLDGFLGGQVSTPTGSFVPPVVSVPLAPQIAYGSTKQGVPCIFFQKGLCLKGDRCQFFHAPNSMSNKVPQPPVSITENPTFKKAFGGLEKSVQENKFSQANIMKSGELGIHPKPVKKLETPLTKNDSTFDENVRQPNSVIDVDHHRYRPSTVPPTNGNSVSRPTKVQQSVGFDDHSSMQSKDDEISREPSPGFDVLVDDELRGSDYYHGEDQYGRARGNDGRSEYDIGHPADYNSVADIDQDMYHDVRGYDSYDRLQYGWVQRRDSSERTQGDSLERRRYGRADSPEQVGESDLRHRLSKHKRVNGLRSVISHDSASEKHVEDRGYRSSRRDGPYVPSHDSSRTGRLQGRIKLPSRSSSPNNRASMRPDREMNRTRDRGWLSPERPQLSSQQGRLRDRIKGRVPEDLNSGGRNNRGPLRRDISENNSDFAGPKRLSELKGKKSTETNEQNVNEQQALGKRKFQKLEPQTGDDISFKGPMPLQEILKRKRSETGIAAGGSEGYQHERKDHTKITSMTEGNADFSSTTSRNESDHLTQKEESEPPSADHQSPLHPGTNELEAEAEEGMIVEGADQNPEGYDQLDGDYDYEQADGEDYNLDEGENADANEEYLDDDDDDGDDFAKKLGVVFS